MLSLVKNTLENICLDLVKQHKIYLNELKCTKMHSRSTAICVGLYGCVCVCLSFFRKIQFPWGEERASEKKLFFYFLSPTHINNALLYNINLLHLMRIFFFLFVFFASLFVCSVEKTDLNRKNEWEKGKKGSTITYTPKVSQRNKSIWSWIYTSAIFLFLFSL